MSTLSRLRSSLPTFFRGGIACSVIFLLVACGGTKSAEDINALGYKSIALIGYDGNHGTGFFIEGEAGFCTLATVKHVVPEGKNISIQTTQGRIPFQPTSIFRSSAADLAIVKFKPLDGNCPFPALKLGNSESVKLEDKIYIAGYPGSIGGKTPQKSFYITSVTDKTPGRDGYAIGYKADTLGGTSGSPVFNQFGEVIAVHGRSYLANPDRNSRAFFDLGIPINVFKVDGIIKASQQVSSRGNGNSVPWISIFIIIIVVGGIPSLIVYFLNAKIFRLLLFSRIGIGGVIILTSIALLNPYSYFFIGEIKYNLGQKEAAILDYNKAIELNPNYAIAYNNRGVAKYNLGQKEAAILDYNKAIELNPNYANAYYGRGFVKENLGDKNGAKKDYEKAAELYEKDGNETWKNHALNAIKNLGI